MSVSRSSLAVALVALLGTSANAQTTLIAITNVTVVDGTGRAPMAGMTVVIRSGRIAALTPATSTVVPAGATVVDGSGKFLIPGLWDMHVHLAKAGENSLNLFLANGVTSVRDMGGDFAVVRRWRDEIAGGTRVGPRIRSAGPIVESDAKVRRMLSQGTVEPVQRTRAPVADTAAATRVVDSIARLGADFIKMRTAENVETYHAVASAARRNGLALAAHGDIVSVEEILRAGQRSVEHAFLPPLQKRNDTTRARIMRELAAARVAVVPTIVNYFQWLVVSPGDARRIIDDTLGRLDPRRRYVGGYLVEDWREQVAEREGVLQTLIRRYYMPRIFRDVLRDYRELHLSGVTLLPGTDVAVALMYPGFSFRDELGYFVDEIHMTPMEALVSATRKSAEFSGMLDSLGTVEVGKVADLALLDADPLADIRHVGRVHAVVARGALFDRARLDSLLAAAR